MENAVPATNVESWKTRNDAARQAHSMPVPTPATIVILSWSCTHAPLSLGSGPPAALLKTHAAGGHQHSPIHHQRRSGDEGGPIAGEKRDRRRNFFRLSHPTQSVHAIAGGE